MIHVLTAAVMAVSSLPVQPQEPVEPIVVLDPIHEECMQLRFGAGLEPQMVAEDDVPMCPTYNFTPKDMWDCFENAQGNASDSMPVDTTPQCMALIGEYQQELVKAEEQRRQARPAPANGPLLTTQVFGPKPADNYLSPAQVRAIVALYFQPEHVDWAVAIVACESTFNASAQHPGSKASGLFQHMPQFWQERTTAAGMPGADVWNPYDNAALGAWLFYYGNGNGTLGYNHWVCKA